MRERNFFKDYLLVILSKKTGDIYKFSRSALECDCFKFNFHAQEKFKDQAFFIYNIPFVLINPDFQTFMKIIFSKNKIHASSNVGRKEITIYCCSIDSLVDENTSFISLGIEKLDEYHGSCGNILKINLESGNKKLVTELSLSDSSAVSIFRMILRISAMVVKIDEFGKSIDDEKLQNRLYKDVDSLQFVERDIWSLSDLKNRLKRFLKLRVSDWGLEYRVNNLQKNTHWEEYRPGSAAADPFLIEIDSINWLFFEGFDRDRAYGKIYAIKTEELELNSKPKLIIDAGSHVSYPFCWIDNESIKIILESTSLGEMRIYSSSATDMNFGNFTTICISEVLLDPNIFVFNDVYTMVGTSTLLQDSYGGGVLRSYVSSNLEGPWLLKNACLEWSDSFSRNAGFAHFNGRKIFFAQAFCNGIYGHHLSSYEISESDGSLIRIENRILGTPLIRSHHYSKLGNLEVRDVFK